MASSLCCCHQFKVFRGFNDCSVSVSSKSDCLQRPCTENNYPLPIQWTQKISCGIHFWMFLWYLPFVKFPDICIFSKIFSYSPIFLTWWLIPKCSTILLRVTDGCDPCVLWCILTLTAQMDCSSGWKSLKQKPSFLEGLSMSSQALSSNVPTHWPFLWVL